MIKFITDSSSDIPAEMMQEFDIRSVATHVIWETNNTPTASTFSPKNSSGEFKATQSSRLHPRQA